MSVAGSLQLALPFLTAIYTKSRPRSAITTDGQKWWFLLGDQQAAAQATHRAAAGQGEQAQPGRLEGLRATVQRVYLRDEWQAQAQARTRGLAITRPNVRLQASAGKRKRKRKSKREREDSIAYASARKRVEEAEKRQRRNRSPTEQEPESESDEPRTEGGDSPLGEAADSEDCSSHSADEDVDDLFDVEQVPRGTE